MTHHRYLLHMYDYHDHYHLQSCIYCISAHHLVLSFSLLPTILISFNNQCSRVGASLPKLSLQVPSTIFICLYFWPYMGPNITVHPLSAVFLSLSISAAAVKIYQILFGSDGVFLHRGHQKQPACLLDTNQTLAFPAKCTPLLVITKKMQRRAQPIISNFSWRKLI